ncbi:MAG: glycoside hydrolase family 44 protein [Polyangiaceae bacterium]
MMRKIAWTFLLPPALLTASCKCSRGGGETPDVPVRKVATAFKVDCKVPTKPISPLIYGISFDITGYANWKEPRQWELRPTARRLGGNAASRYNWEQGSQFNHASDWYFANNGDKDAKEPIYASFVKDNVSHGATGAAQVPALGWVAKDMTSASFPVAQFPGQKDIEETRKMGSGLMISGRAVDPPPPTQTSVAFTPASAEKLVGLVAAVEKSAGARSTKIYILDNEPGLWNSTHRDVHPEPMTYDELIDKTIKFSEAIRRADPTALIAGPASFGFAELMYSARDLKAGPLRRPDKSSHGDLNMMPYYLKALSDHEKKTGQKTVDLVDVHFYPQSEGVGMGIKGQTDASAAAMRIRSARGLWDPTYVDESWIKEPVKLLPRLRDWIATYYPGRGIQIGEWNFGAENHMSSGLATAEALGRFAEGDVKSAFYYPYPTLDSAAYWGFRAFRNYDGKGGHFLDELVASEAPEGTSLWVSRDPSGKKLVLVALNFNPDKPVTASVDVGSCGTISSELRYEYTGGARGFKAATPPTRAGTDLPLPLAPYSITVIELSMNGAPGATPTGTGGK